MLQFVWVFCFCFGFTSLKKFGVQCYPTLAQGQYHNRPVAGCNSLGGTRGWWVNFFWDGTPWGLGLFCKSLGNLKPPTKKKSGMKIVKWHEFHFAYMMFLAQHVGLFKLSKVHNQQIWLLQPGHQCTLCGALGRLQTTLPCLTVLNSTRAWCLVLVW